MDDALVDDARDDIREIESLLSRFGEAVSAADVDVIRSCYAEAAVSVFTGTTGRIRGRDAITEVWQKHVGDWADVRLERTDTVVRIHGDTAWATFTWSGAGSADGARYRVDGERWSVVLLWEDGGWRLAQTHSSLPFADWQSLKVMP